jgi:hypothetical protein
MILRKNHRVLLKNNQIKFLQLAYKGSSYLYPYNKIFMTSNSNTSQLVKERVEHMWKLSLAISCEESYRRYLLYFYKYTVLIYYLLENRSFVYLRTMK